MIRKIENKLFKVNTYADSIILEVDDFYDEDVQEIRKGLELNCIGYKLTLFVKLAEMTVMGYAISSVTEFNANGSKPKVAYANDKDFKKIKNYYLRMMGKIIS